MTRWIWPGPIFVFGASLVFASSAACQVLDDLHRDLVNPQPTSLGWIYPKWKKQDLATATYAGQGSVHFPSWSAAALQRMGSISGMVALHRDLALLCSTPSLPTDVASRLPDCGLALVDPTGSIYSLGRHQLLAAQRLPGNRCLILTRDLKLMERDSNGNETLRAESVAVPRVSEDGEHVVFTQFDKGITELVPGLVGVMKSLHLASGTTQNVTEDPTASSPFPVPGTMDVLFLSARTGLASIWLASPGKADRQITNLGQMKMGPGFIPVYGQEKVWIPNTKKVVYTASYGSHVLWSLDIETGKSKRLGNGRLPQLSTDGGIIAYDAQGRTPATIKRFSLESL